MNLKEIIDKDPTPMDQDSLTDIMPRSKPSPEEIMERQSLLIRQLNEQLESAKEKNAKLIEINRELKKNFDLQKNEEIKLLKSQIKKVDAVLCKERRAVHYARLGEAVAWISLLAVVCYIFM